MVLIIINLVLDKIALPGIPKYLFRVRAPQINNHFCSIQTIKWQQASWRLLLAELYMNKFTVNMFTSITYRRCILLCSLHCETFPHPELNCIRTKLTKTDRFDVCDKFTSHWLSSMRFYASITSSIVSWRKLRKKVIRWVYHYQFPRVSEANFWTSFINILLTGAVVLIR
jgi:hypothetical protein